MDFMPVVMRQKGAGKPQPLPTTRSSMPVVPQRSNTTQAGAAKLEKVKRTAWCSVSWELKAANALLGKLYLMQL
ncbi:MAG: hypothetical protein ACU837_02885 [Gammaproteobacteria bacterium]